MHICISCMYIIYLYHLGCLYMYNMDINHGCKSSKNIYIFISLCICMNTHVCEYVYVYIYTYVYL